MRSKFRNVSLQAKEWTWVNCKLSGHEKLQGGLPPLRQARSQALRFGSEKYIFKGARFFIIVF